ncbi:hypothetical protein FALBO_5585 [Fusarium albosuccineum]|uniref:Uncharacterized protein n=1 Tax=Fusarium albosuccineum TaxID=1237068 RepID=A0A8H4LEK6_9HYPO|nr:hypothetical protein FALBO_5585 [Fusarium albosuccineum]
MDQIPNLPTTPTPDLLVAPTDRTFHDQDAAQWTDKEPDEHRSEQGTFDAQSQEKVTRWMKDRIGVLYCDLLPKIPSVIYPSDKPGSYMHIYPNSKPDSETLRSPSTPGRSSPVRFGTKPTLLPEEQYCNTLNREKRFHDLLTKAGGRPWYPIERIESVSRNPTEYAELLQYWRTDSPGSNSDDWVVFERQWERWDRFRHYQSRVRQPPETFAQHSERCQKHLAKYSFSRAFQLEKNSADQDELSQWIEYLCFECFEYEKLSWYKQHHEPYKEAWRKLFDSKILRPHETLEKLENIECEATCENERTQLRQAVEEARSHVLLAERDLLDPSVRGPTAQRKLFESQAELDTAIKTFDIFQVRKDAIDEFRGATAIYREARRGARRHRILLRWIRDQIPLIEKELGLPPLSEDCPELEDGRPTDGASDWSEEDEEDAEPPTPLLSDQLNAPLQGDGKKRIRSEDASDDDDFASGHGTPPKRSRHDAPDKEDKN